MEKDSWYINTFKLTVSVAVKQLTTHNLPPEQLDSFLKEISLLKKLRPHANVILVSQVLKLLTDKFYGVMASPLSVVLEFADLGSLLTRLTARDPKVDEQRTEILMGVSLGMYHLHNESIIHRDLAARNVLLTGMYQAKIAYISLYYCNIKVTLGCQDLLIRQTRPAQQLALLGH